MTSATAMEHVPRCPGCHKPSECTDGGRGESRQHDCIPLDCLDCAKMWGMVFHLGEGLSEVGRKKLSLTRWGISGPIIHWLDIRWGRFVLFMAFRNRKCSICGGLPDRDISWGRPSRHTPGSYYFTWKCFNGHTEIRSGGLRS